VPDLLQDGKSRDWTFPAPDFPRLCLRQLALGGSRLVLLVRRSGSLEAELDVFVNHVKSYESVQGKLPETRPDPGRIADY